MYVHYRVLIQIVTYITLLFWVTSYCQNKRVNGDIRYEAIQGIKDKELWYKSTKVLKEQWKQINTQVKLKIQINFES